MLSNMTLEDALTHAHDILASELAAPTLTYKYVLADWPPQLLSEVPFLSAMGLQPATAATAILLPRMRKQRPRDILVDTESWQLDSVNYNQLMAIYSRLEPNDRSSFLSGLLEEALNEPVALKSTQTGTYSSWNGKTSVMPLLTELCIRCGGLPLLMDTLHSILPEYPKAHVILMARQLEEMLSFDCLLFTAFQWSWMHRYLQPLYEVGDRQTYTEIGRLPRNSPMRKNLHYKKRYQEGGHELVASIEAIAAQCKDAQAHIKKGQLTPTLTNTEPY